MEKLEKRLKRTMWARRSRDPFSVSIGVRADAVQLERFKAVAKSLNVDVSDLVRVFIMAIAALPQKPDEIGSTLDEIKAAAKVNPPTTSDNTRYV